MYVDASNATYATFFFLKQTPWPHLTHACHLARRGLTQTTTSNMLETAISSPLLCFPTRSSNPIYQIPGTMANFLALYFPPNSFLYLRSFFLAQTAICPTAIAMKSAVLQCLLTIKIAIQAIDSKV